VLLTARSAGGAGIGVRVRIGLTVEVRAPGKVVRRLELGALRVRGRTLALLVANRGNVAERLARGAIVVRVYRRGRLVRALPPRPRDLLPYSRGVVEFPLPRALHGRMRVVVGALRLPARGRRSFSVSF
jgi:hypothetical protein